VEKLDIPRYQSDRQYTSRRRSMKRKCILVAALCLFVLSLAHVASAQDAKVAGSWDLSAPGRDGNVVTQTLTLQQDGTKLSGTVKGARGEAPVTGTVTANNISFSVTRTTPNGEVKIEYTGTVSGDAMKGTLTVMGNTADWTARRSAGAGSGN
jgi:hypothetical protein